jgi:uncharacterized cupredoxin-like copper-binding protein
MNGTHLTARKPLALMALATLGLLPAACGSSGSSGTAGGSSSSPATSAAATTSTGGASMSGRDVNVSETEFTISLPTMTFTPGEHTFKITNKGTITHALEIDGPGVSDRKSDAVSPGASTSMTVTLQKGTYEVYCPVDGHKASGMQTMITVH